MSGEPSAASPIRILGIDPGLRITGFGVIEKTGSKLAYLTSGCVRTPDDGGLPLRLKTILDGLREVIATHRPQQVAVEIWRCPKRSSSKSGPCRR